MNVSGHILCSVALHIFHLHNSNSVDLAKSSQTHILCEVTCHFIKRLIFSVNIWLALLTFGIWQEQSVLQAG